jgi:hypothetical protein
MEGVRLQLVVPPGAARKVQAEADKNKETVSQWLRRLVLVTLDKRK